MSAELSRHIVPGIRPPAGAYVHAVAHGGLVYCAGQVGAYPDGTVPEGVGPQTTQALANLAAILATVGSSLDRVVKATVYIRDAAMFAEMDAAFSDAFSAARPTRTTIPGVNFRAGVDVEIDLIAAAD
jgi:2-iminobutanoate/2-iminopropanoate deaminase